jgi:hypothetical protein
MIEILQGETLAFALSASDLEGEKEDLKGFQVKAVLRPSESKFHTFRRDCVCDNNSPVVTWNNIEVDDNTGVAKWFLTSLQSARIPVGKYAMEVALRDKISQQEIKNKTIDIIEVKTSYTL